MHKLVDQIAGRNLKTSLEKRKLRRSEEIPDEDKYSMRDKK